MTTATSLQIDTQQAIAQLRSLGYKDGEPVYYRTFPPKGVKGKPSKFSLSFPKVPKVQGTEGGLYFVVNGDGHSDQDVKRCKAVFFEHDDRPKDAQRSIWQDKGLPEPTEQTETRKSIHTKYAISGGCSVEDWRELQQDLLEYVDGDRQLKNPSRVMRLAGAWHIQQGEEPIRCNLIHNSGKSYTYEELRAIIPRRSPPQPETKPKPQKRVDAVTGDSQNLADLLHREILPRLSPEQAYNWAGHQFQYRNQSKIEGCCPWHESKSGTAFYADLKDGVWIWRCSNCEIGGGPLEYRHRLKGGDGDPRGKDFVDLVKGLACDAGVEILEPQSQRSGKVGEVSLPSNEWNSPVSWQGEIGCWKKGEEGDRYFLPQCNFDFQVVRELESEDGGGLEIAVKRSFDRNEKTVFIESTAYTSADKFVDALKRAMGTGVVCNLNKYQLNALIHTRTQDYRARGGKTYRLAERRGCQPDGTWVFEKKQFKPDGTPTTTEESGWVYTKNFPKSEDYIPEPVIEDHNSDALKRYVLAKQRALGANFAQSLLMDRWVVSVLHDAKVLAHESTFPLFCFHGDAGSFKSVIAECSVGLAGFANSDGAILSDASESLLFERLKYAGSLPILWDDPKKTIEAEIDEMSKKVFNRFPRSVRGNIQHPQGGLAYTANWVIGEKHAPTRSRFISVFLPVVKGGTSDDFYELRQARREVNRCFPDLLKLGYPYAKVKALEQELTQYLPQAHSRTSRNLAIILHYAMEVVRLSGVDFDIKQWVVTNLTPQLNESHSGLDSVTDFAEKLETLKARSLVGEWNFVEVRTREHGDCVALHLPSIWTDLEKEFKPAYNRSVLEKVLIQRGAFKGVAKFWEDRDLTLAYKRRLVTGGSAGENADQPQEPDKLVRKCLLIPKDVWDNFYNPYDFEPQVEEGESYQEQVTSPLTQVTSSNLKLGNCSNQVAATFSSIENNPSNQVTTSERAKPLSIEAKQEAEQHPEPGDRIVIRLPGTTLDGKGGVFRGAAPDPQGIQIADVLLDEFYHNRRQWSGPVAFLLLDKGGKQSDS